MNLNRTTLPVSLCCIFLFFAADARSSHNPIERRIDYPAIIELYHPVIPTKRKRGIIDQAHRSARKHGFDLVLPINMIAQETGFENQRGDENQEEPSCGYMQIKPSTAEHVTGKEWTCEELMNHWRDNINIGLKYVRQLMEDDRTLKEALAQYNGGNDEYAEEIFERAKWFARRFAKNPTVN